MTASSAVIAECQRRGYREPETLAVLTLAIEQDWTAVDTAALDRYEAVRDGHHSTVDAWYNLAASRGIPPNLWQQFKNQLYTHIRQAKALYDGEDDPLSSFTDDEKRRLFEVLDRIDDNAREIRAQLGPRAHRDWPSLGLNDDGEELTLRDAFGVMKSDVAAIKDNLT